MVNNTTLIEATIIEAIKSKIKYMKLKQVITNEPEKVGRKPLENENDRVVAVRFYIPIKHVGELKKLVEPIIKKLKNK